MFIEKIKFRNKVINFDRNMEIFFGNSQKNLIDFYIKTTLKIKADEKISKIYEYSKLSDKIQINCILGENGVGKSCLLDEIYNNIINSPLEIDICGDYLQNLKITFSKEDSSENSIVIYDSFFIGHKLLKKSINYDIISKYTNGESLQTFYENIQKFLDKKVTNKVIFSSFFNIDKDYSYELLDNLFQLKSTDGTVLKNISNLSSGEKIMLIRFVNIYKKIQDEIDTHGKKNFIILIDEPDLHLHLEWQKQYIQRLIDVFSTFQEEGITMHFIIATHSPFIISDLPKENIIKLEKKDGYIEQILLKDDEETFGANYIDIIRNGFFKDGILMGSFSADIISNLALIEKLKLAEDYINVSKLSPHEEEIFSKYVSNNIPTDELKNQIGDEFLRDNLLYFKAEENEKN